MEEFQKLGSLVENRWKAENYSETLFPEIAAQALTEANLSATVDPWEIIRWVHTSATLPEQKDVEGRFGDPPITLFSGSRFFIDVYFWLDGTTSIHQHSFTGAFQVLLGSSIHSRYTFCEDRSVNEHLAIGRLNLEEVQLLQKHDVRKIQPGRQFIHSLFHLDRPSATITVRSEHTPTSAVQYDYRKPYFAVNPFFKNVGLTKKLQTVVLLLGMKHNDAVAMIGDLVSSSDFQAVYQILEYTFHHFQQNEMDTLFGLSTNADSFQSILGRARAAHGDLIDLIMPMLEEQIRQKDIIQRRITITGEEHRFFLALLLNVSSREKILELVSHRYPEQDPVETILDWVEELASTRVLGSKEPNLLGIDGFTDLHLQVLEWLFRGFSDDQMRKTAEREFHTDDWEQSIEQTTATLRQSNLFKAIFNVEDVVQAGRL